MAYIGNIPAESYASFERQVFTIVNSQTAYTLTHAVTNENDIRLVVNNVVQEPGSGKAYTASGTSLTLSAALVNGTDEMYCVYLGRALQTVNPPNASVGNSQTAPTIITGQTAETSIATDDTILIHDTSASALRKMTRANFVSGVGGANTPAFEAYASATQTGIGDNVSTKMAMNTEVYDTNSKYDTSNYRFTPGVAGKYFVYGMLYMEASSGASNGERAVIHIYKNGSSFKNAIAMYSTNDDNFISVSGLVSTVMDLNDTDYVELFGQFNVFTGNVELDGRLANGVFGAYRIIT